MPLADTQPQGITVGGDGNLWFTEGGQNKIGSLNPYTHVIINYAFEPAGDSTNDLGEGITAAPNETIWFVTQQNDDVNEFDHRHRELHQALDPRRPVLAAFPAQFAASYPLLCRPLVDRPGIG